MPSCAVLGCRNRTLKKSKGTWHQVENKGRTITYHRFPRDPILRQKWEHLIQNEGWHASVHSRICSVHFTEDCFTSRGTPQSVRLIENSMPTIFAHCPTEFLETLQERKSEMTEEDSPTTSNLEFSQDLKISFPNMKKKLKSRLSSASIRSFQNDHACYVNSSGFEDSPEEDEADSTTLQNEEQLMFLRKKFEVKLKQHQEEIRQRRKVKDSVKIREKFKKMYIMDDGTVILYSS